MWKFTSSLFQKREKIPLYYSLKKGAGFVLDTLLPVHCLDCGQESQSILCSSSQNTKFICPSCFEKIPLNQEPPLRFSQKFSLTSLIIASSYDYPLVKQAIHHYKYDFVKDLAKPLGQLMVKRLNNLSNIFDKNNSLLVPVPLHKKRLRWRGFNQAELLAEAVNQELKIPLNNNLLIRKKYSLPQMQIKSSPARKENIKKAFGIGTVPAKQGQSLSNKTIILVDDICTTGATLEECALTLRLLKPKAIWGLVVARG